MDIESILNTLGLDLTNPETKRGALEAIEAILASRQSDNFSGGGGGNNGGAGDNGEDIEIDPDLIQPSIKNTPQIDSDDIEINDEDDILKDIKHNESEDQTEPLSNKSEAGESSSSDSSSSSNDSDLDSSEESENSESEQEDTIDNTESNTDLESSKEKSDTSETAEEDSSEDDTENSEQQKDDQTETELDTGAKELSDEEEVAAEETEETSDSTEEQADEEGEEALSSTEEESSEEESEDEFDIDEDELLDDELKDPYEDQEQKTKHNARKIKRERTLAAAKAALADAQVKKKTPALIRELEKAIEALESLQEAVAKNIADMSDEEFNLIINRVFDAIDALGDSGLTYSSEEERQAKVQEIKTDIESKQTQAELSAEDVAQIRAETQAAKAREKEKTKYATRARGSFKGFQDFLNSLYRAIALQVHTEETRDDSWSAINRRYSGTGVLQQGKKINELPNKKIPVIDFYFDLSGSWTDEDVRHGEKAVEALVEMEEKGQIKINIFYFSDDVYTSADEARGGGTSAWNDIVKNVIATQATNVVIMTDSDMEDWWRGPKALSYTVPGYVWYLWRDGVNAPRLPRDLKGRGGTQQFAFARGSI